MHTITYLIRLMFRTTVAISAVIGVMFICDQLHVWSMWKCVFVMMMAMLTMYLTDKEL